MKIRLDITGDGFITTSWVTSFEEMKRRIKEELEKPIHMTVTVTETDI